MRGKHEFLLSKGIYTKNNYVYSSVIDTIESECNAKYRNMITDLEERIKIEKCLSNYINQNSNDIMKVIYDRKMLAEEIQFENEFTNKVLRENLDSEYSKCDVKQ